MKMFMNLFYYSTMLSLIMSFPKYSLEYEILYRIDGFALYNTVHVTRYKSIKTTKRSVRHDVGKNKKVNVINLKTNIKNVVVFWTTVRKNARNPVCQRQRARTRRRDPEALH